MACIQPPLQTFVAQHGRLPQQHERFEGIALGMWVTKQRAAYKGKLKPERVAALEALPGWTWNPQKETPTGRLEP